MDVQLPAYHTCMQSTILNSDMDVQLPTYHAWMQITMLCEQNAVCETRHGIIRYKFLRYWIYCPLLFHHTMPTFSCSMQLLRMFAKKCFSLNSELQSYKPCSTLPHRACSCAGGCVQVCLPSKKSSICFLSKKVPTPTEHAAAQVGAYKCAYPAKKAPHQLVSIQACLCPPFVHLASTCNIKPPLCNVV
jgi:hypothetical protein